MHNESPENLVFKYIRFLYCFLILHRLFLAHSNRKVGSDVSTPVHLMGWPTDKLRQGISNKL